MFSIISIILKNVNKKIKGEAILSDINLQFEQGKVYGLYGRNGSGKTMLLRMIAGLIKPSSGVVLIEGKELHKEIDFPESVGVLIETSNFWKGYTGLEVLSTLASIKNIISETEIINSIKRVGLDSKDKRTIRKYSLGMKQRVGIAQAIMESPRIILLDEPTNALDKSGVKLVENIIKEESEKGSTIIIASHNINDLNNCDKLIEIDNGYAIEGK